MLSEKRFQRSPVTMSLKGGCSKSSDELSFPIEQTSETPRRELTDKKDPAGVDSQGYKETVTLPMKQAIELVTGDRNASYGDFYIDMEETAARWTLDLKRKLKEPIIASDVPRMLISLKQTREGYKAQLENCTDICGYAGGRYYCAEREKEIRNGKGLS